MRIRILFVIALAMAQGWGALAQDSPASPAGQNKAGQGHAAQGSRRGMGYLGSGVIGTVTEVTADHYTVRNDSGETWTIHYSANTRIMKQSQRPAAAGSQAQGAGGQRGMAAGGNPPQPIKAMDIKAGDAVAAMGEVDQGARSVGAVMVMQLDPATASRMEQMRANFGKTWLSGRVTAIKDTSVMLEGGVDNAPHTFVADENTTFRKRREPIALADIQVGDTLRVEGSIKDGQFVATTVNEMMPPQANGGPARRQGPPPQ